MFHCPRVTTALAALDADRREFAGRLAPGLTHLLQETEAAAASLGEILGRIEDSKPRHEAPRLGVHWPEG